MKQVIYIFLLFTSQLYAVHIGTGKHLPDGPYIANYVVHTTADKKTNSAGDSIVENFGFTQTQNIFRPLYYKGNFVYQMLIPYKSQKSSLLQQEDIGIGDIKLGIGYFIPNSFDKTELGVVGNIEFPTGEFDKNRVINNGSGRYALNLESYIHKVIERIIWDGSVKYNYNFKNHDNNIKNGDKFLVESSFAYIIKPTFLIGPNISYSYSLDNEFNGVRELNTGTSKYTVGLEAYWAQSKKTTLLVGFFKDINVKNTLDTKTFLLRIFIKI